MKTAVVLFNLGAPTDMQSVQPFLFNLFNDPAIIGLPNPFRFLLAKLISKKRCKEASENYEILGGKSPLLENTEAQAEALEALLGDNHKVFIAMRYWKPFADETAKAVKDWGADKVVLLPLYPQFSTTTTGSSLKDWHKAAGKAGLNVPTSHHCCYPIDQAWVNAVANIISQAKLDYSMVKLLFSAHGLPQKIVDKGDPYQWQVEQTVAKVVEKLAVPDLNYLICYQSRVGPLKWIEPNIEDVIKQAGADKQSIAIIPIAFVSEHSETLVELDVEYKELAEECGIPEYHRLPTVQTHPLFIEGLAELVHVAEQPKRYCPADWKKCPQAA